MGMWSTSRFARENKPQEDEIGDVTEYDAESCGVRLIVYLVGKIAKKLPPIRHLLTFLELRSRLMISYLEVSLGQII